MKVYNGFTGKTEVMPSSSTIQQMRQPAKYWVISDAQLKRDLAGRTLVDVYRDNHVGRIADSNAGTQYSPRFGKYEPRTMDGPSIAHGPRMGCQTLLEEYLADCYARGHTPHPASIDSDHAQNCHREKAPKPERITGEAYAVGGRGAMPYREALAEASAIHAQTGVFASIVQVL